MVKIIEFDTDLFTTLTVNSCIMWLRAVQHTCTCHSGVEYSNTYTYKGNAKASFSAKMQDKNRQWGGSSSPVKLLPGWISIGTETCLIGGETAIWLTFSEKTNPLNQDCRCTWRGITIGKDLPETVSWQDKILCFLSEAGPIHLIIVI